MFILIFIIFSVKIFNIISIVCNRHLHVHVIKCEKVTPHKQV